MGVDGGEYSLCRKRGIGFGGEVCRARFLCETARGDFRVGDSIENRARQSRAPLRAVARTRAPAERPASLDDQAHAKRSSPADGGQEKYESFFQNLNDTNAQLTPGRTSGDCVSRRISLLKSEFVSWRLRDL